MVRSQPYKRALKNIDPGVQPLNAPSWTDLSHFLELASAGSLREAARQAKVSVNTIRARLSRLEQAYGGRLVIRGNAGISLTSAGREVHRTAVEMRRARLSAETRSGSPNVLLSPDKITIACTEGLGTGWLTPRIGQLKSRLPDLTVEMQFDYDLQRDRTARADVGLTFLPPADPELISFKLGMLHFMLFASPAYLREHGTPTSMDDLRDHFFVEQVTPGYSSVALDLLLGADRSRSRVAVQTNSVITQLWATANSVGIAVLPSYTRAITSLLIPLPVLPQMRFPVNAFYHAEARESPPVRTAIDWLRESFDPERYPWFADRFVHPDDFPAAPAEPGNVIELYEHMADRVAGVPIRRQS